MTRFFKSAFLALFLVLFLAGFACAEKQAKTKNITAENTFSDSFIISSYGYFNFSLSGTWAATVYVQRSYDSGSTWMDVKSYTANTEAVGFEPQSGVYYRFGVKTGGYTSGTIAGRISQ